MKRMCAGKTSTSKKNITGGGALKLENYCEVIGTLTSVSVDKDHFQLVINIDKKLDLPLPVVPLEKLQNFLGKRVGIFNCCGNYKIREINSTGGESRGIKNEK